MRRLLTFLAALAPISACTILTTYVPAGRSFEVRVEHEGQPLPDIAVAVTSTNRERRLVARTDAQGLARFRSVPVGQYDFQIEGPAPAFGRHGLDVRAAGPDRKTFHIESSWRQPSAVSTIQGIVHAEQTFDGEVAVEVVDWISGQRAGAGSVDPQGRFAFAHIPPGKYFLKVSGASQHDRQPAAAWIPVEVRPDGSHPPLEIDLAMTSCGLFHFTAARCPQRNWTLDRLEGRVVDPSGAVIADAQITLSTEAGQQVVQLRTAENGQFAHPEPLSGRFRLAVTRPGFNAVRTIVTLGAGAATPPQGLQVELGVMAGCSSARLLPRAP